STCMSGPRASTEASARSWCGCMAARFISARPTALSPTAPIWRGAAMSFVVAVNHRLNILGHLDLAAIGGERYAHSGNAGTLDLVAALEWVRDNIERFGGDPGNITIFGESGGGGKVSVLLAMPKARGLFHR